MKILVIDDSKAVCAFLREALSHSDFQLTFSHDGEAGLKAFQEQSYDLVLLDWEMPKLTGPEVLASIRKISRAQPVIMMTTKSSQSDILHAIGLGASEYMTKPFTLDILHSKIELVCPREFARAK